MPWSNNDGNNGGNNPWGTPPPSGGNKPNPPKRPYHNGNGGQQPPNELDDLLRKGQDMFPGGGKIFILVAVLFLGVFLLSSSFYRVQPDERGIVLVFGKWNGVVENPGLHMKWPSPVSEVIKPKVAKINRIEVGYTGTVSGGKRDVPSESLMLTKDQNIIAIDFQVTWKISNPADYLFNIRDPEATIKKVAESVMREVIGQTDIQPALTQSREEIATKTFSRLQEILNSYQAGVEIVKVNMEDVKAPEQVIDAFDDVQRARADRERLGNEAEAYSNSIIPEARGEATKMREEAEAYKEQVVNEAQGDAARFLDIYESYKVSPDITRKRIYLETMEEVLSKQNKIFIDSDAKGQVLPYLPLDRLMPSTPSASK